jgi:hypothetical protein
LLAFSTTISARQVVYVPALPCSAAGGASSRDDPLLASDLDGTLGDLTGRERPGRMRAPGR